MPGLPPIPYDTGTDIPACPLLNSEVPFRFKIVFSGIILVATGEPIDDIEHSLDQLETNPARYANRTDSSNDRADLWLAVPDGPLNSDLCAYHISLTDNPFWGYRNPRCQRDGIITLNSTDDPKYTGGIAIITTF